jgi:hypothetical protein
MFVDTQETSFLHDLSKPSMEALSHILRHEEMWPEGFKWDFGGCYSCAMGLAHAIWKRIESPNHYKISIHMDMPENVARDIFVRATWCAPEHRYFEITPEMVADQIDKYLATK